MHLLLNIFFSVSYGDREAQNVFRPFSNGFRNELKLMRRAGVLDY
jgi:hypothetical protein